jgi:rhodanese/phosphatase family protein
VTNLPWLDDSGLVTLPTGARVRGRRSSDSASPADFALVLGESPLPAWPNRRIRWRDFWIPSDRVQALNALRDALRRAHEGERVEVICRGGIGRTGTALAALAILDGLSPEQAVTWIRDNYHPRAVETLWQQRWLGTVR